VSTLYLRVSPHGAGFLYSREWNRGEVSLKTVKGNLSYEHFYRLQFRYAITRFSWRIDHLMERMGIHRSDERMMAAIA
jgi:hypothetical protein